MTDTLEATPPERPLRRPDAMRALFADPAAVSEILASAEAVPEGAIQRLAQFHLLYGLPFNVLVPDARMLPPDSIRFFFLDDNWPDALIDGALSTVIRPGGATALAPILRPLLQDAVAAEVRRERARRLEVVRSGCPARTEAPTPGKERSAISGFLMRSAAVADWPGLRVRGFANTDPDKPLNLLRMDRLAPAVLLVLFDGVPERVVLDTPLQNPGFGVRADPENPARRAVVLRGLGGERPVGKEIPDQALVTVPLRPGPQDRDVIDVAKLHGAIAEALRRAYEPRPAPPLRPAGMALQLIDRGSQQILINLRSDRSDDEC